MEKEFYRRENGVIRYYANGAPNGKPKAPKEPKKPKETKGEK